MDAFYIAELIGSLMSFLAEYGRWFVNDVTTEIAAGIVLKAWWGRRR